MNIRVIIEWDEEAESFSAICPELNYIASCGDTKEEAINNLKDAIALMLEPIQPEFLEKSPSVQIIELAV
ncbi:MAG TPA: type II toxin-antitoxin system HicB family antitoxin [Allocoleopsis sp.]